MTSPDAFRVRSAVALIAALAVLAVGSGAGANPAVVAPASPREPAVRAVIHRAGPLSGGLPASARGASRSRPAPRSRARSRSAQRPARVLSDAGTVATGGMRVAIDPETGRPTTPGPEQLRGMASESRGAGARRPLEVTSLPGGGTLIRFDDRFMAYAMARRDSTGRMRVECVPGGPPERNATRRAPPAPPVER